jgi:methylated-DNA-[protein]-cysteine S-methyltransferase
MTTNVMATNVMATNVISTTVISMEDEMAKIEQQGHRTYTVVQSPIGPLTLAAADGVLCALYMEDQRYRPQETAFGVSDDEVFGATAEQLADYFASRRTEFDISLTLAGTVFQREVWAALREIPFGTTSTYRELAERIGRPTAIRAVGLAVGHNPLSVIVPCHRVVGANGSLTGYAGGLPRKQFLLELERAGRGEQPMLLPA